LSAASKRALTVLAPLLADRLQTAHAIKQLRELSTVDSVPGCSTRPDGLERLRAELKRAHRSNQQVAVLMLDLDFFKSVNDRYGHQCGDAVLANIGNTIMQTLRVRDAWLWRHSGSMGRRGISGGATRKRPGSGQARGGGAFEKNRGHRDGVRIG